MSVDVFIQIGIIFFSCTSVFLFSTRKYFPCGFIVGLLGQPFWFYATFTNEQWGMFIVSIWFTCSHIRGIKNHLKTNE